MGELDPVTRHASRVTSVILSCLALGLVFWGGLQVDLPLARFLRSIDLPWLVVAGDVGSRLGSGEVLAGISGALLAFGLLSRRAVFRRAGLESLIAHAAVALSTQALKHLIGRPRPRMTHSGWFQFGPSWDSGLDSFPSGHAAASFAVAAVLARRFPSAGWVLYGAACFVALSRVLRGSHFPTDVLAGVGLGLAAGYVVANPIHAWRSSLSAALKESTPYLVGAFALLWTAVNAAPDRWLSTIMFSVGACGVVVGAGHQLAWSLGVYRRSRWNEVLRPLATPLVVMGLAAATTSWLVMSLTVLLVMARWQEIRGSGLSPSVPQPMHPLAELTLATGLVLALVAIQTVKGMLPLL